MTDGVAHRPLEVNAAEVASAMQGDRKDKDAARELSKKYKVDSGRKGKSASTADNPHKVLPLIEVDLHIGELTDTLTGMEPKDMLEMQARRSEKAHESQQWAHRSETCVHSWQRGGSAPQGSA